jgi:uncharacterized protein
MNNQSAVSALLLGISVCVGLIFLGSQISNGIIHVKSLERTVTVKGLSEREVPADIAIWPITFQEAGNDLNILFSNIQEKNGFIIEFLENSGFNTEEISISPPGIFGQRGRRIQQF